MFYGDFVHIIYVRVPDAVAQLLRKSIARAVKNVDPAERDARAFSWLRFNRHTHTRTQHTDNKNPHTHSNVYEIICIQINYLCQCEPVDRHIDMLIFALARNVRGPYMIVFTRACARACVHPMYYCTRTHREQRAQKTHMCAVDS